MKREARGSRRDSVRACAITPYPGRARPRAAGADTRAMSDAATQETEGVTGIVLRAIADDPKFDTSNYHGIAERHWGFIRADGSKKPSFKPLLEGIRREALN